MSSDWSNEDTRKVSRALRRSSDYSYTLEEVIYECEQEGLSKDQAVGVVASWIDALVEAELRYSNDFKDNVMAQEFLPDPSDLDVDYNEIAEDCLLNYEPAKSGNRAPARKAPAKKKTASKPKTSGKKPAAKASSRRY